MLAQRKVAAVSARAPIEKLENNGRGVCSPGVCNSRCCSGAKTPLQVKASPIAADRTAIAKLVEIDLNDESGKTDKWKWTRKSEASLRCGLFAGKQSRWDYTLLCTSILAKLFKFGAI